MRRYEESQWVPKRNQSKRLFNFPLGELPKIINKFFQWKMFVIITIFHYIDASPAMATIRVKSLPRSASLGTSDMHDIETTLAVCTPVTSFLSTADHRRYLWRVSSLANDVKNTLIVIYSEIQGASSADILYLDTWFAQDRKAEAWESPSRSLRNHLITGTKSLIEIHKLTERSIKKNWQDSRTGLRKWWFDGAPWEPSQNWILFSCKCGGNGS